jgi:branched-chain amino acid transport system substrate-binding protein
MKKVFWGIICGIIIIGAVIFVFHKEIPVIIKKGGIVTIRIGVTGPKDEIGSTLYMNGVKLALNQYNSQHKTGKKVELLFKDDRADINTGLRVAQSFVNDPSVVGVLGHWESDIAIPAADIYEKAGLPMLSPVVSNPKLFSTPKDFIFRTIPGDEYIADLMAQYASSKGIERMAVYYDDDLYGIELSKAFCKSAEKKGILIIDRHTNFVNKLEMELTIQKWRTLECQAIFIAEGMPEAGRIIHAIKANGLNVPILGDWGLDLSDVIGEIGKDAEGLVYPTLYNPSDSRGQLQQFVRQFKDTYHQNPDLWAALGYDALKLMVHAIDTAKGNSRADIAIALRSVKNWPAVLYNMTFDAQGGLTNLTFIKKKVHNGEFVYEK